MAKGWGKKCTKVATQMKTPNTTGPGPLDPLLLSPLLSSHPVVTTPLELGVYHFCACFYVDCLCTCP